MSSVYTDPHYITLGRSNLNIVYILLNYLPLSFAPAIMSRVTTFYQDDVCSFYLFVIAFFVTLGVIPRDLRFSGVLGTENNKLENK